VGHEDMIALDGKVAIVTGGAGGIGREYGRALGVAGASVVLADLDGERAQKVAGELRGEGLRAIGVQADVTSEESTHAMAAAATGEFGGIDILVNNAALMAELPQLSLMEFPLDWWDRVLRVNLTGPLLCARACVPSMIERGGGKIINQSSGGAFVNGRPYGISKMALISLTHGLARDLGAHRINVNAIAPGAIETESALSMFPVGSPWRERMHELTPLPLAAGPKDLFGALLFLASPASDWVTGQCINVDGGWVMRF
jgi:NAD(P)-dependent dehydrogenase (short-subunit alcohol dehydrogenase family)